MRSDCTKGGGFVENELRESSRMRRGYFKVISKAGRLWYEVKRY